MKKLKKIFYLILMLSPLANQITTKETTKKQETLPEMDFEKEVIIGQSAFLGEGSLQLYGELIRNAILARFNRVNSKGGIQGKTLRLISLDDRGKPEKTYSNVQLMLKNKIDIFLGNTGTRSIFKVLPLMREKKILNLFPWGGDETLRRPDMQYLVNGLGWMQPQLRELVKYSLEKLQQRKIAIFHDDGDFGITNKNILVNELEKHNIKPVSIASYNRFTMDIESPAKKLIGADPKVVLCLATSRPTVKLINQFFEQGHYGTRFVGLDSTMFVSNILYKKGATFHYTSSVPDPEDSKLPIVEEFREDLQQYFPYDPPNILSLSYYIHAAIVAEALKKITGPITKEKLLEQIEQMKNYDLGGFLVDFNDSTRHAYPHNIKVLRGKGFITFIPPEEKEPEKLPSKKIITKPEKKSKK